METFSALLARCAGNSPVTGEFHTQRPVTRSFDVSLVCTWINGRVNNREAGDLRRYRAHYDVTVISILNWRRRSSAAASIIEYQCVLIIWHHRPPTSMYRQWLIACSASSHYLNQCWRLLPIKNKFQWQFSQNINHVLKTVIWKCRLQDDESCLQKWGFKKLLIWSRLAKHN